MGYRTPVGVPCCSSYRNMEIRVLRQCDLCGLDPCPTSTCRLAGLQVLALTVGISRGVATTWIVERAVALVAVTVSWVAVYWSRSAYPDKVSALATQATGWNDFMCGLSVYGHQVATLHMASMCFVVVPCVIFLGVNSVGALAGGLFFTTGWRWSGRVAIQLAVRWILVVGSLFAVAAFASQTSVAYDFWQQAVLTKEHDPFSRDGKGFSFCRQAK